MKYFPIFLALEGRRLVVAGGGEAALAKLRLLLKTEARIEVFAKTPSEEIRALADAGKITLIPRAMAPGDAEGAALFYAAHEESEEDARTTALARAAAAPVNWVDNLKDSDFITPAIVDRDPVTVAIGTEGAAPVLARAIKADLEEHLPRSLGALARIGKGLRHLAEALPFGHARRAFWTEFYFKAGPQAFDRKGTDGIAPALGGLLANHLGRAPSRGHVTFVGAGLGDPELLTVKARRALHEADVVVHDRLVTPEILELARREARIIEAGKQGFGPSTPQEEINALLVDHAKAGHHVLRLKSGDATIFGRLDEELDACETHGIAYSVIPGITAASAAVASIGQSFTRRGRNSSVRLITGHDVKGYAEQDWRALARPGEVAAIYMGKRSARFLQGRLMMHGAAPGTPITLVENISRPDQRVLATTLAALPQDLQEAGLTGPALILLGLAPREQRAVNPLKEIGL